MVSALKKLNQGMRLNGHGDLSEKVTFELDKKEPAMQKSGVTLFRLEQWRRAGGWNLREEICAEVPNQE